MLLLVLHLVMRTTKEVRGCMGDIPAATVNVGPEQAAPQHRVSSIDLRTAFGRKLSFVTPSKLSKFLLREAIWVPSLPVDGPILPNAPATLHAEATPADADSQPYLQPRAVLSFAVTAERKLMAERPCTSLPAIFPPASLNRDHEMSVGRSRPHDPWLVGTVRNLLRIAVEQRFCA